jgi:hypothetical protein
MTPPEAVESELVQPGEGQHIVFRRAKVVRDLLPVLGLLPLVISLRRAQRPALDGGPAERRLVQDRLAVGVDQPRTGLDVQTDPVVLPTPRMALRAGTRLSAGMGSPVSTGALQWAPV